MGRFEQIIEARQRLCEATPPAPAVTPHQQPAVSSAPQVTADQLAAFNKTGQTDDPKVTEYLKTQTPGQLEQLATTVAAPPPAPAAPAAPAAPSAPAAPAAPAAPVQGQVPAQGQVSQTPTQGQTPYQQGQAMAAADIEAQKRQQAAAPVR